MSPKAYNMYSRFMNLRLSKTEKILQSCTVKMVLQRQKAPCFVKNVLNLRLNTYNFRVMIK